MMNNQKFGLTEHQEERQKGADCTQCLAVYVRKGATGESKPDHDSHYSVDDH
jgi:hypothetical protein